MTARQPAMLSLAGLRARGWTPALVAQWLPEPDRTAPNPHYRSGPPMKLYALERVEAIEATDAFAADQEQAKTRSARGTRAAQTKRTQLLTAIEALQIRVPQIASETLTARACDHYNALQLDRERWEALPATPESDIRFLERITVNYLRHALTSYERQLARVFGKVGVREAYQVINRKVYDAISAAYPQLKAECARQLTRKQQESSTDEHA